MANAKKTGRDLSGEETGEYDFGFLHSTRPPVVFKEKGSPLVRFLVFVLCVLLGFAVGVTLAKYLNNSAEGAMNLVRGSGPLLPR